MPLSALEHRHLMSFKMDRMGALRPTSIVSYLTTLKLKIILQKLILTMSN